MKKFRYSHNIIISQKVGYWNTEFSQRNQSRVKSSITRFQLITKLAQLNNQTITIGEVRASPKPILRGV